MEPKQEENDKNNINNNKSGIFPIIPFQKRKRKSVQLGLDHLHEILENHSIKIKPKNVEGNKFKKIPKNTRLTNLSLVLINKELMKQPSNKDKNYYNNLFKTTDQNLEKEVENEYIKKKLKEMNERVAEIQSLNRRNIRKGRTLKEKSNDISTPKKSAKTKRKRKTSFNKDNKDKTSKNSNSKKKKKKKFNSSHSIVNVKNKDKFKDKKAKEINIIRRIINDEEKVKKLYLISEKKEEEEKKENEEQNKDSSAKMSNSNSIKLIKENKENIINNDKKAIDNKKEKNNKKEKKKEVTNINNNININYIETKNNYEVKPEENSENKKNKKRKIFCFCCLTKDDNNSSDFD